MRNAKIVCTLGPASDDQDMIHALARAGMSVARLNASHGNTDHREEVIERVRAVDDMIADPLAVMVDLKGPEIRTAVVEDPLTLQQDSTVVFHAGEEATPERIGLTHTIAAAGPGDTVLLDDGRIECRVEAVDGDEVSATVLTGGQLGSRMGVNLPGVDVDVDLITPADEDELELAARTEADFVAASFVRDGDDVYRIADRLEEYGGEDIPVIAKIERAGAVENLDGIIAAADGVMVARGDLGVECPLEDVPVIQKRIIRKCITAGVPVITATEMLDSMIRSRRPTRAEASDVANAVLDGTDAVMLSGETAIGAHPVTVVETMDRIVREVESSEEYAETREQRVPAANDDSRTEALARSARYLARDIGASAIVAVSESGYTARKTAMFRPGVPIITTTPNDRVRRQLALSWGVQPITTSYAPDMESVLDSAVDVTLETGAATSGDTIVVLSGMMTEIEGTNTTNTLKVHVAAETLATGKGTTAGRVAAPIRRVEDGDLSVLSERSILVLDPTFDAEFSGDLDLVAGIIDARPGMTGYPAVVAREIGVPMVSGATLSDAVVDGDVVTLDGERGVVYDGDVIRAARER